MPVAAPAIAAGVRSRHVRPRLYATLVGLLCSAFVVVTNALAGFWESTYRELQRIAARIRTHFISGEGRRIAPTTGGASAVTNAMTFQTITSVAKSTQISSPSASSTPAASDLQRPRKASATTTGTTATGGRDRAAGRDGAAPTAVCSWDPCSAAIRRANDRGVIGA